MRESATRARDTDAIASLDDIARSFGDLSVLKDLSITIPECTITAIVGPNGSGKTTLARIIAGVLPPDTGQRTVMTNVERPIGYLPQEPQFRPAFTVEETLRFYAGFLEHDTDIDATMERVGLTGVSNRRVDALSGGMRRLLGLAQSLLGQPPLVVLDEPTSGLDPRAARTMRETIAELAQREMTVFLSTHILPVADELADRVGVIHDGRLVAEGTPTELKSRAEADDGDADLETVFLNVTHQADPTQTESGTERPHV